MKDEYEMNESNEDVETHFNVPKKLKKSTRNLTMLMDFYELTMANGYFVSGQKDTEVIFDLFYRNNPDNAGFSIFAGLEQVIEYIENLSFSKQDIAYLRSRKIFDAGFLSYLETFSFHGTITSVPEGTVIYPNTPLLTVKANLIEAQLIETMLLLTINHQSLIATKANRIVSAAQGKGVLEFGARRAHSYDAAILGARAAYIGGAAGTATTIADVLYGVPAVGTMAHSWIQLFASEYDAFATYAKSYPEACTLLVDTYDVLKSGVPNAIRVANEVLHPLGKRLKGIRIDSGDLAYLSKQARRQLDEANLNDCNIIVSNSVDEFLIRSLIEQGAKIDTYAVGERLITSRSEPVFGGVYKLVAVKQGDSFIAKIKVSETLEKTTTPGYKTLYRIYDKENGKALADYLTLHDEVIDETKPLQLFDPHAPWKKKEVRQFKAKPLHEKVYEKGKLVYELPALKEIREYVSYQLQHEIYPEEQRFEYPHTHFVDLSTALYELKHELIQKNMK